MRHLAYYLLGPALVAVLFALACLLASCGFASAPPSGAPVYVELVAAMEPYSEGHHGVGYTKPMDDEWRIWVKAGFSEDFTRVVIAHELLHVLGLSPSHGEPHPCLGSESIPGPGVMILCEVDRAFLAWAVSWGVQHVVYGPEVVNGAVEYLNGEAGAILFVRTEVP